VVIRYRLAPLSGNLLGFKAVRWFFTLKRANEFARARNLHSPKYQYVVNSVPHGYEG
jgi:hypothetical protein